MDIHGYPQTIDIHGYPWISGSTDWISKNIHGYPHTDIHGYPWILDIHRWISMDIHGYPVPQIGYPVPQPPLRGGSTASELINFPVTSHGPC